MTSQIAWITGGGSGLGRAVALKLASEGWSVAITARTPADLKAIAALPEAQGRIHAFACDVTDRVGMARVVEQVETRLGPIGLTLLCAGIYLPFSLDEFSAEKIETLMRVNVGGVANA